MVKVIHFDCGFCISNISVSMMIESHNQILQAYLYSILIIFAKFPYICRGVIPGSSHSPQAMLQINCSMVTSDLSDMSPPVFRLIALGPWAYIHIRQIICSHATIVN